VELTPADLNALDAAADLVQAPRYDPSTGWTTRDTPAPQR
jgi:hypothetical protein